MIEIHKITDFTTLMMWREEVIRHVFGEEPSIGLLEENRRYFKKHIAEETHYAIVAQVNGVDAGCGSICFYDELPSPDNPNGKCAYLMNIYVRQPFRQHGIAHEIVRQLIAEANSRECGKIYLETTADGRSVYQSLGFRDMNDIMKYYD